MVSPDMIYDLVANAETLKFLIFHFVIVHLSLYTCLTLTTYILHHLEDKDNVNSLTARGLLQTSHLALTNVACTYLSRSLETISMSLDALSVTSRIAPRDKSVEQISVTSTDEEIGEVTISYTELTGSACYQLFSSNQYKNVSISVTVIIIHG